MRSFAYATLIGLVLAGIIHIVIVLLIPSFASRDAWANLENTGDAWRFNIVAESGKVSSVLPLVDPAFGIAACRYDLSEAPLQVQADGKLPFWSVAIFDRFGRNIFSFNDRTAVEGALSMIVVNAVQMARIRKEVPEEAANAVLVEATLDKGFVLIRALQNAPDWEAKVNSFLQSAKCTPFVIGSADTN
ncbi:MAG: DUF1254 domain-containing protein [Pseudomonadota bacterium]